MKLYAFTTPDIPKHDGYLKIGETHGDIDKRIKQESHELNVKCIRVWDDAIVTERTRIDKMIHRYLTEHGFPIQQFDETGQNTEWIKCTVADVEKAFNVIKTQVYNEELQREEVGQQFYLEIRNWFYWTAKTGNDPYSIAEPEYTLRLIIRLMLCFFLQEKGLVPKELFDEHWLNERLKENEGYRFYNAILRNIFFHCLNTPIKERQLFEHVSLIKNISKVKEQFQKIPFLNGGLFNEMTGDDFAVDNYHFFADKHIEYIQELDGNYEVEGIVRLLSKYKYKLSLDDLIDHTEYANIIDPEFIGKVFE
ncbi:MAG: GIY-YIG nuclease family protein, partial [Planctomycetaceae bacterium]|nr:GIY-YIG nuclease family protein [Planctomycetaceae bacterium]